MKFRELAVVDLSYRVAQPLEDGTVKHYILPINEARMIGKTNLREEMIKILKERFGAEIEIEPSFVDDGKSYTSAGLITEDVTHKLSLGAQILLAPKFSQTIIEYLEERPVAPTFLAKVQRFLKKAFVSLAWRRIRKDQIGYATHLVGAHYGLPIRSKFYALATRYKEELYIHRMSALVSLAVTTTEARLQEAYEELSRVIEIGFGSEIRGSLDGVKQFTMADTVGDGQKRYIVWAGVYFNQALANAINNSIYSKTPVKDLEENLLITREGGIGKILEPNPQIIEERL